MSKTFAMEPTTQSKQQRSTVENSDNLQERIRVRAYELYETRGFVDGHHEEDWYQAEQELRDHAEVHRAA